MSVVTLIGKALKKLTKKPLKPVPKAGGKGFRASEQKIIRDGTEAQKERMIRKKQTKEENAEAGARAIRARKLKKLRAQKKRKAE